MVTHNFTLTHTHNPHTHTHTHTHTTQHTHTEEPGHGRAISYWPHWPPPFAKVLTGGLDLILWVLATILCWVVLPSGPFL
jgi:hypothetical protein